MPRQHFVDHTHGNVGSAAIAPVATVHLSSNPILFNQSQWAPEPLPPPIKWPPSAATFEFEGANDRWHDAVFSATGLMPFVDVSIGLNRETITAPLYDTMTNNLPPLLLGPYFHAGTLSDDAEWAFRQLIPKLGEDQHYAEKLASINNKIVISQKKPTKDSSTSEFDKAYVGPLLNDVLLADPILPGKYKTGFINAFKAGKVEIHITERHSESRSFLADAFPDWHIDNSGGSGLISAFVHMPIIKKPTQLHPTGVAIGKITPRQKKFRKWKNKHVVVHKVPTPMSAADGSSTFDMDENEVFFRVALVVSKSHMQNIEHRASSGISQAKFFENEIQGQLSSSMAIKTILIDPETPVLPRETGVFTTFWSTIVTPYDWLEYLGEPVDPPLETPDNNDYK